MRKWSTATWGLAVKADIAHIVQARRVERQRLQKTVRSAWRAYHTGVLANADESTLVDLVSAYDEAENRLEAFNYPCGYLDVFATDSQGEWAHA